MRSVKKALRDTLSVLQEMKVPISKKLSKETALTIIEAILKNFQMHYQAMYKNPVHRKGTITQNTLEAIQIGNEYDLQRMLYSLLLPIFPTVRQEVTSDNGYGSMRADLYVDDYDVVVETKCTRDSMSEKKLVDELGADGFHYKASTIFFFVYDKASVIKNPEAFKKVFIRERNTDGKRIRMVIVPPRCL